MGAFGINDADHYGGTGGAGFFRLVNDKDVAKVRFLYGGIDDVQGYAVHQVNVDGKNRYVNCIRSYKDPKDACPLCREGNNQLAKVFVPLYNIDEDKVQIWDRGKTFFSKISSICSRYPDLVSHTFEVERNGKAGSTSTTYEIYPVDQDDTTLDDFEIPDIFDGVVLDKSADDMEYFLQEGEFPPEEDEDPVPNRRRSSRNEEEPAPRRNSGSSGRRTPASNNRRTPADKF